MRAHPASEGRLRRLGRVLPLLVWLGGAPSALGADLLKTGTKLYSQRNEELIIRDFFQDRRGGFFLDVGAAWPVRNNTTYYLEKHLGWQGIAVDALPDYGPMWAEERPTTRFFNFIVTDHTGGPESFYRAGGPASPRSRRAACTATNASRSTSPTTRPIGTLRRRPRRKRVERRAHGEDPLRRRRGAAQEGLGRVRALERRPRGDAADDR